MSDSANIPMSLPLDGEGFLRRECPTCEREFKWATSPEGESEPVADGGYFCPYCGIQAPPDAWWTNAQLALAESIISREVVLPGLDEFRSSLAETARSSGGTIKFTMGPRASPPDSPPLTEADDMRRVDFACHSREPIKILEDWTQPVYCLICGRVSA
ncbi:MAG: hypothetical protein ACYCX3_11420 [Thermoleophilia bacterium]